jgi:multiple sugar transport system permease protein
MQTPIALNKNPKIKKKLTSKEWFWGYICLTPIIIGFIVFTVIPIIMSLYYSFTEYDGITEATFVGINNYIELFKDSEFLISLKNTAVYTVFTVIFGTILSLVIANLLNSKIRGSKIYRSIFFVPNVISFVAIAMIWQWMYNEDYGLFNSILGSIGLYQPPWLTSTAWAMPSVIIMSIWKGLGFSMVIFLAGLQGISSSYYEAAVIDGANGFQKFFYITVPLLKNTTLFVLVISMISAFQAFDQVYLLTAGGPERATQVVVYQIYMNAFQFFKQGYASAMSYILFIIIFVATLVQFKVTGSENAY